MDYIVITKKNDYLEHHGILGQKWGVRRYQNKDGSLTEAGKKRRDQQFKEVVDLYKKKLDMTKIFLIKYLKNSNLIRMF